MRLEEIETLMLNVGLVVFAGAIFFIIYDLAKKSNAGRFGTFVLFFALGLGLAAFLIKTVIVELMEGGGI
ncbi:DUF2788 domain-containing protein [Marinobacterium sp. AK62]|uniref:DUF2788 domain-containing protein n=1 Tax=Marinobacterium alkalitolerans TaxID=1542925 RepID=A0ABS3ZBP0_9GAMM|nr:DUF2788 domain-containing protein [Marinobacterium alkalitolerans]MBP0049118.1 DUF2788 domain-containing protein [Marinobacterium alkalitolerans]